MDDNGRLMALKVVTAVLLAMSFVMTALRCYVRKCLLKSFWLDDWCMVVAMVAFLTFSSLVLVLFNYGYGKHESELSTHNAYMLYLLWWLCYLVFGVVITVARISVGLLFLRITIAPVHRTIIWTTIGVNLIAGVCYTFVVMFQCTPVPYYWNKVLPNSEGRCIKAHQFANLGYTYGAVCAFIDFIFVLLPFFMISNLRMHWKTKLTLIPILGMAGLAGCCPLVRMIYLRSLGTSDFLYQSVDIATWSLIEAGIAIVAPCLVTLRPLLHQTLHACNHYFFHSRSIDRPASSHTTLSRGLRTESTLETSIHLHHPVGRKPDLDTDCSSPGANDDNEGHLSMGPVSSMDGGRGREHADNKVQVVQSENWITSQIA